MSESHAIAGKSEWACQCMGELPMQARTIFAFESERFEVGPSSESDETNPSGINGMRYLLELLVGEGVQTRYGPIVDEEHGGALAHVEWMTQEYTLYCHWHPVGEENVDTWFLVADGKSGMLRTLFGRPATDDEFKRIVEVIQRAVADDLSFQNGRWLTMDEYRAIC